METARAISSDDNSLRAWMGEIAQLWTLAWPLALAQAGQALLGVVDTAVVGRVSSQALGAVGLGNALFNTCSIAGVGVVMGIEPLIAQSLGANQPAKARTWLWQGAWVAGVASIVLAIPLAVAVQLLESFGVEASLAAMAREYTWWRFPQLFPFLMFIACRAYLQAVGLSWVMFAATALANVANGVLSWYWVLELGWGVRGAALATVVCAIFQVAVMIPALGRSASTDIETRPSKPLMRKIMWVGSPIGFQMLLEVGVFAFAGIAAGAMNEVSIAAHQIAITWASVTFCLAVGIGSASAVRVGLAVGQGDRVAARRSGFAALSLGILMMTGSAFLFIAVPHVFSRAMSDVEEVVLLTSRLFLVAAVFQIFDGIQAVGAGALRGAGDTRVPFLANFIGHYLVGLPIALFLGMKLELGVVGLWWGLCAGLISVALLLAFRFHRLTSQEIRAL